MLISRERILSNARELSEATGGPDLWMRRVNEDAAEKAVAGEIGFRHLGTRYVPVGRSSIDWSAPQITHQEWPAQLNRFFQLAPLAAAYRGGGDERYAEAARDYVAEWIAAHPVREGWRIAPYDNTLNLSIRMMTWLGSLPAFLESPAFDDELVDSIVRSASCQLGFLSEHLTPHHNWRIAQADSLLACGLRLAPMREAEGFRALGVRVLNDAFHRQVLADGAHDERNPGYHQWMNRVFEKYWRLGRKMPDLGLAMDASAIARMHDYALAHTRPNGSLNGIHDSHGRDAGPRPETWGRARSAFLAEAGLLSEFPATSQNFRDAGQACWRDSWEEDAVYVVFDATTWGGGHCHLSRGGVQLHAYGRSLLVDPGTLTYERTDPMMAHCKSTRAHNTVSLNGWNQSFDDPTFRFVSAPGYDLAECRYAGGYWPGAYTWSFADGPGRGIWGEHHRTLLWVRGRFLVVVDRVTHAEGGEPPSLECNWQFSAGEVSLDEAARAAVTRHDDGNVLVLMPVVPEGGELSLHAGEHDPPRGWLGDGGYVAAPQLCLSVRSAPRSAGIVTVLVPFRGRAAPEVRATADAAGRVELAWGDGSTDALRWSPSLAHALGRAGEFDTDGALLHMTRGANGQVERGLVVDGTYVDPVALPPRDVPGTFTFGTE